MKLGLSLPEMFKGQFTFIKDELDNLIAHVKGGWFQQHDELGGHKQITATKVTTPELDSESEIAVRAAMRWNMGPWSFNPKGNTKGNAVLRPADIAANQSTYGPQDIEKAIWLELNSETDGYRITKIKVAQREHRLMFVFNRGSAYFVLVHSESVADPGAYYPLEFPDRSDFIFRGKSVLALFQDPGSETWRPLGWAPVSGPGGGSLPLDRCWYGARADGINATPNGFGMQNPTELTAGSANNFSDGTYNLYTSGAAAGNTAGWNRATDAGGCQANQDPSFTCVIRTGGSIAGVRFWIGLTQTLPTNADDLGGTSQYAMFRYSPIAGDTGWVGVTRDGTTQSVTAQVAAIAINSRYKIRIWFTNGGLTVNFSVNDGTPVSTTSNEPAAATALGYAIMVITTEAVAKSINVSRFIVVYGT